MFAGALVACGEVQETVAERVGTVEEPLTVSEAVGSGCATKIVEGLSKQIFARAECIAPGAFSPVPKRPNATFGGSVLPYMQAPGRDALLKTLDANKGTSMTINSMMRSVAQQYLLHQWYLNQQCGIALAAKPGTSNHETGLAIDIQEYGTWRPKLEANGFAWLGSNDPVHFDYKGPGSENQSKVGVMAFQQLWNLNHPEDPIAEDGVYGPQTEARLKKSPAEGFASGPGDCGGGEGGGGAGGAGAGGGGGDAPPELEVAILDATDAFADGPSKGVVDLVVGKRYQLEVAITNSGSSALDAVDVTIALPSSVAIEGKATATLRIEAVEPGQRGKAVANLDATTYSVMQLAPGSLTATALETTATLALDVYSDRVWEFDGERLEGWTSEQMLAVTSTAEMGDAATDGELVMSGPAAKLAATSPAIDVTTAGLGPLVLRARRSGDDAGVARLYVDDLAFDLDLPADGELHELTIAESALPPSVKQLRFVPFEGGVAKSATASVASLRLGDDRGIRGGEASSCECGIVPGVRRAAGPGLALVALGLTAGLARRRRRSR